MTGASRQSHARGLVTFIIGQQDRKCPCNNILLVVTPPGLYCTTVTLWRLLIDSSAMPTPCERTHSKVHELWHINQKHIRVRGLHADPRLTTQRLIECTRTINY